MSLFSFHIMSLGYISALLEWNSNIKALEKSTTERKAKWPKPFQGLFGGIRKQKLKQTNKQQQKKTLLI